MIPQIPDAIGPPTRGRLNHSRISSVYAIVFSLSIIIAQHHFLDHLPSFTMMTLKLLVTRSPSTTNIIATAVRIASICDIPQSCCCAFGIRYQTRTCGAIAAH
jgi:hypothetical protein